MSSENALTGRLGKHSVGGTNIARITQWSVNPKLAHTSEWGDSDSGGYTNRAAGRWDCTFSSEGKFDISSEVFDLFMPGDIVASVLKMDLTRFWTFARSLCSDFKLTVNVDTEDVVGWTSDWGSDGVFVHP